MRAEELRIGNWVNNMGDPMIFVGFYSEKKGMFAFRGEHELSASFRYSEFEPIPLTEEWLERFGFKNSYDEYWGD